ncbi:MAG TPA: DUF4105 domain-containing protein [Cyclobacteriaceae bacterium]|nr:DUF4105 domain-containing protein [Cyclobacteriaceae bacterium]
MRILLFYFLVLINIVPVAAQRELSPEGQISVITCGPWQGELWSAFGHNAFRVYDPVQEIDEAYNYGVFSFEPGFYLNFARGYNYYMLGVYDYQDFKNTYIYYNRYVHEQVLNLTAAQKQELYDYLQWNALPENRKYLYDYFYDNCATRIRDVVINVLGDSVRFDGSYIKTNYSIRQLTDLYLQQQPWGDLGIDICLGLPMDKRASPYEYMFLPDYIESGFDHATIKTNGRDEPLVKATTIVYSQRDEDPMGGLPNPFYVFGFFASITLVITIRDLKRKRLTQWFDIVLFSIVGLIGLLLTLLWFATDHKAAAKNFNLLWALPTHLIIVFLVLKDYNWLKIYFLGTCIIMVAILVTWKGLPQQLNLFLVPMIIALLLRSFCQYSIRKSRAIILVEKSKMNHVAR